MTRLILVFWAAIAATLILSGCSSSFRIQVVEGLPREVYLTFSKGENIKVGDRFVLYEVLKPHRMSSDHGHAGHSEPARGNQQPSKHMKALAEVVQIVDEGRALLRILSGEAEDGLVAEPQERS